MDETKDIVTADEFAAAVLANSSEDGTFEWHGIQVRYRPRLSLADMELFVDTVTKGCFDENTGAYAPEAKHFALQLAIVAFYTNVDLGDDLTVQYELLTSSDFVDAVSEHIDRAQLKSVTAAIDEKIRYTAESNVAALQRKIESAYNELASAVEQMQGTFSGVSGSDIEKLVGALAEGGLDEKKLMDAYLSGKYEQAES